MSEAIDDLRKARDAAIDNRREHGRRLSWLKAGGPEQMTHLIRSQQIVVALDAAIASEEERLRRGFVNGVDYDEAPGG